MRVALLAALAASTVSARADGSEFLATSAPTERAFQAELTVNWNGADRPPVTLDNEIPVIHQTIIGRDAQSFETSIVCCNGMPDDQVVEPYGPNYFMAGLSSGGVNHDQIHIRVELAEVSSGGVFSFVEDTFLTMPETWDEPATVMGTRRIRPASIGLLDRRERLAWRLTGIEGPWENTDLILFDGDVFNQDTMSYDHFTVTLDRFGWLPEDEVFVSASRRARAGGTGLGAAAVPEPEAWLLVLLPLLIFVASRVLFKLPERQ